MPMLPLEWKDQQTAPDGLQPTREPHLQHPSQPNATSSTHEAFPSTTLHPQLWANLTKLGWPMNVKPEVKNKVESDQGLDLSASSNATKPNPASSNAGATNTMESLIRHQRDQLLARASLSSDPASNLDPNSAAAAFAIAAVAAAAAQQQSNPHQQTGQSHLPSPSPMPYATPSNNLPYFQSKPKVNEPEIIQSKKRPRIASPEPPGSQKETTISAGTLQRLIMLMNEN